VTPWEDSGLKRNQRLGLLLLCLALVSDTASASRIEVADDAGNQVQLNESARRIVSLAPHITEILFAAGAGARLVGTVDYSDYPEQAGRLPRVGSYNSLDIESIVALRPDLVVAWQSGNSSLQLARLQALGLTIYFSEPRAIEDVVRDMERLGKLAGTTATAEPAAAAFRRRLAQLRRRYSGRPAVSVFYEIWNQPLMTVNGGHLISHVIRLCGGRNVFADLAPLAPVVDVESVIRADPQAIVASGMGEQSPEWLDAWRRYPSLSAVRSDNLFSIPPDLIQRSGPRVLDGAERLCRALEQARARRQFSGGH